MIVAAPFLFPDAQRHASLHVGEVLGKMPMLRGNRADLMIDRSIVVAL